MEMTFSDDQEDQEAGEGDNHLASEVGDQQQGAVDAGRGGQTDILQPLEIVVLVYLHDISADY